MFCAKCEDHAIVEDGEKSAVFKWISDITIATKIDFLWPVEVYTKVPLCTCYTFIEHDADQTFSLTGGTIVAVKNLYLL